MPAWQDRNFFLPTTNDLTIEQVLQPAAVASTLRTVRIRAGSQGPDANQFHRLGVLFRFGILQRAEMLSFNTGEDVFTRSGRTLISAGKKPKNLWQRRGLRQTSRVRMPT